jgi:hypothetical protein
MRTTTEEIIMDRNTKISIGTVAAFGALTLVMAVKLRFEVNALTDATNVVMRLLDRQLTDQEFENIVSDIDE